MSLLLLFQSAASGGAACPAAWAMDDGDVHTGEGLVLKNTAGQKVGCQLVSATDGSAFTSAVTVSNPTPGMLRSRSTTGV